MFGTRLRGESQKSLDLIKVVVTILFTASIKTKTQERKASLKDETDQLKNG